MRSVKLEIRCTRPIGTVHITCAMIEVQGRTGEEPETGSHASSSDLVGSMRIVRIKKSGDDGRNCVNEEKTG